MNSSRIKTLAVVLIACFAFSVTSRAQTVSEEKPTPSTTAASNSGSSLKTDEVVVMSPFDVRADRDNGYIAASTLGGTRMNTPLGDTSAPISVMTKDFLQDIGAMSLTQALEYVMNGSRDWTTLSGDSGVLSNDVNIQVRGFVGTTLTRNYFPWSISSDSFNMERIDVSRGPNAILYGVGAPGGVINTTSKRAVFGKEINELAVRVGSWNDIRATFDVSRELHKKFAMRINGVWQDKDTWRDFETSERVGVAGAFTYKPFKNTEIRVDSEYGDVNSITVPPWPFGDAITPWIKAGRPISPDSYTAVPATTQLASGNRAVVYDPYNNTGPMVWLWSRATARGPAVPSSTLQARSLSDTSIMPDTANLWGPGQRLDYDFSNISVFLEQRMGPFTLELAYNTQQESRHSASTFIFNTIVLQADPNAIYPNNTLPDFSPNPNAGKPNPNVGKYYVQGNAQDRLYERSSSTYRATLAYELPLEKRSAWLGNHQFALMGSRDRLWFYADGLAEVNITPAGNLYYPIDVTNANNQIYRRTYIDFTSSDPLKHAAQNPLDHPIVNQNGVTSGFRRVSPSASNPNLTYANAGLIAGQSSWLKRRVILTYGGRRDNQHAYTAGSTGIRRDAVTGEYLPRFINEDKVAGKSIGNTRTYGVVVHILPWLAGYYNNANSFVPQTIISYDGKPIGGRNGKGEDVGIRLTPWDGKVNLSIGYYQTSDTNKAQNSTNDSSLRQSINNIWNGMQQYNKTLPQEVRDAADGAGQGWEIQLVANPTKYWKIQASFSDAKLQQSNTYRRTIAYVEANRPAWNQAAATDPDIAQFIKDADMALNNIVASDGTIPRQFAKYNASAFTSYTLPVGPTWLKGWAVGFGTSYQGRAVVGYQKVGGRNNVPFYNDDNWIFNAMLSRTFKLGEKYRLNLQLNVANLLDNTDYMVLDADVTGVNFYRYQTPRSWGITAKLMF